MDERLKSKKSIGLLFSEGFSVKKYPLSCRCLIRHNDQGFPPIQYAVTVPRRLYKRAVDRNLIKRRLRAAFHQVDKQQIQLKKDQSLHIAIIYIAPEILSYQKIEKALGKIFSKIKA